MRIGGISILTRHNLDIFMYGVEHLVANVHYLVSSKT